MLLVFCCLLLFGGVYCSLFVILFVGCCLHVVCSVLFVFLGFGFGVRFCCDYLLWFVFVCGVCVCFCLLFVAVA